MTVRAVTTVILIAGLLAAPGRLSRASPQQANPAAAVPESPPFVTCPGGAPLGGVDLSVYNGLQPLPFRTINHLTEGDVVRYAPLLRGKEKRPGEVALILVPESRLPGEEDIIVTSPEGANRPREWKMPRTIALAALVYGPSGLNRKNVAKFLAQDEVLVAQLADYADKTAQAEQLVAMLSNAEISSAGVNAALNGFASQYGFAVQIDKSAPVAAQAQTLFATMNPQLANYNPLASSTAARAGQTTSMASMAATLFFGNPVGVAAGGAAMALDLRAIAFPDTQFRAAFAQPSGTGAVNLCGQQGATPPRTRIAYIWANRIPNIQPPMLSIGDADYVPLAQKTSVPVNVPDPGWKYLDRVREWALVPDALVPDALVPNAKSGPGPASRSDFQNRTQGKIPIGVIKLGAPEALELDLTKATLAPGDYRLTGMWDWTPLEASGVIHVRPLTTYDLAHLVMTSQNRLLAKNGKAAFTVVGSDFQFTTKVELKKLNDDFATAQELRFRLPTGLRKGPQDHMDVQIDTQDLTPGPYALVISQQDGKGHAVSFDVLPNPPKINNLPIIVNRGEATQHFALKGERLDLLARLEAQGAVLQLDAADPNQSDRTITVTLQTAPKPGTKLSVKIYLLDRSEPITIPNALEITGPLPVIASSRLSLPAGMAIAVHSDEFPAGATLNAMLDVKNIERQSRLHLQCADGTGEHAVLKIGEQNSDRSLQQLSPDQLFLAFDTSTLPAGCAVEAVIDNGRGGSSPAVTLAHIIRMPRIESLTVSFDPPQDGTRRYSLTGRNLEMIASLGWDERHPVPVANLPEPLPGPGLQQSLEVNLMDAPEPLSKLLVWLRGDQHARTTSIQAPIVMPAPATARPGSPVQAGAPPVN